MKKYFIVLMILMNINGYAQSLDKNYIQTTVLKVPVLLEEDIFLGVEYLPSVADNDKAVQITYFDGLGRPIQQIAHKQSNTGKDIVTHIEYDTFGRQTKDFLPFANQSASLNYMNPTTVNSELSNFYGSYNGGTTNPFSEKQLENSPLNRVFKQAAPGDAWAMGQGKEIKFEYHANSSSDNVKLFTANTTWNSGLGVFDISVTQNGNYPANQLYKTIVKDENWKPSDIKNNTTEEFKDKQGKIVLKRTYNNSDAHDTYYIFDQYGNLTYVLPPLTEGSITSSTIDNLGYQYKYDNFNRLVAKKLPGKQWEYIVYDKLDRPVASGPALSPYGDGTNGWLITVYDVFGRAIQTGWKNATVTDATRSSNQTNINSGSNPFVLGANDILTKNFYDNYSFPGAPSTIPSTLPTSTLPITANVKGLSTGSWLKVIEDATSTTAEVTYILYDTKYRPVHTKTTNYLGGYTEINTNLDWAGQTIYTQTKHKRTNVDTELVVKDMFEYTDQDRLDVHKQQINSLPEQLITKNSYDELGQLISKNVGGEDVTGAISLQKVDYTYNIRGWLKTINDVNTIGNDLFAFKINYNDAETATNLFNGNISETFWKTSSDNKLRKYDYMYDHLNRLLQADYSKEGSTTFNSYLEHLSYDKNGNIQTLLRNGEMDTDGYQFENPIDDLTYLYDANNKNQLLRVFDATANTSGFKDDTDGTNITIDINQVPDYVYDANGNMIRDNNKGINSITYNHLNLPLEIVFPNGKINYLYNAAGQKVKKTVTEGTIITTTDYLSGFQYKNAVLQFFPHAEGYVNATELVSLGGGTSYKFHYVFNYTDHLGNIRLSYSKDPVSNVLKIIEENHYYPFGLKHSGYNSDQMMYSREGETTRIRPVPPLFQTTYDYKYNGKEYQDELGLNMYDYGARNYDPALGRWMNIDPLAENSRRWTPYNYAYNNPLVFVDPDGMQADDWRNKAGQLVYDPKLNGGKGDYTEHATKNDRNIGNALQATKTGKEQFDKLVNSEQVIEIVIKNEKGPKGQAGGTNNGEVAYATDMETGKIEDVEVTKSTINIYMGTVGDLADAEKNGAQGKLNGTPVDGLNFTQILGAVVGHEIEHTTKDNVIIQMTPNSTEAQYEKKPTEVSNKIINESRELNKKK